MKAVTQIFFLEGSLETEVSSIRLVLVWKNHPFSSRNQDSVTNVNIKCCFTGEMEKSLRLCTGTGWNVWNSKQCGEHCSPGSHVPLVTVSSTVPLP